MPSSSPSAPAPSSQPAQTAWRHIALRGLRLFTYLILALWSLLLLAWLILYWAVLPRLNEWKPSLERQASAALGAPVQIGEVHARSSSWVPTFELLNVNVQGADGTAGLHLDRVTAVVSPQALVRLQLRFAQVLIDAPSLQVRRDADGRWHVAGLTPSATNHGDDAPPAWADWLFSQGEFVVRGGAVHLADERRGTPPLVLTDVDVVVRNGLREHALRLDATPPEALGSRFGMRGRFRSALTASAGDWRRWRGELYADLPAVSLVALDAQFRPPADRAAGGPAAGEGEPGLSEGGLVPRDGRAALRMWSDWRDGRPTGVTLDAALADVHLQGTGEEPALALQSLKGRFQARVEPDAVEAQVDDLVWQHAGQAPQPPTRISLTWQTDPQTAARSRPPAADGAAVAAPGGATGGETAPVVPAVAAVLPPDASASPAAVPAHATDATDVAGWTFGPSRGGRLEIDRIDLEALTALLGGVPLPAGWHAALDEARPGGVLSEVALDWTGDAARPSRYRLKAKLNDWRMAPGPAGATTAAPGRPSHPLPGRPGWRGLEAVIDANEQGGQAQLSMQAGSFDFPGVFAEPRVPIEHFSAQADWTLGDAAPGGLQFRLRQMRIANNDAEATVDLSWHRQEGQGALPPPAPVAGASAPMAAGANGEVARPQHEVDDPATAGSATPGPPDTAAPPAQGPGTLTLDGTLLRGRAVAVARYLPVSLPADTRRWVAEAIDKGEVAHGTFQVDGDLADFPFQRGDGRFRIEAQVSGVRLDYVPRARPRRATAAAATPAPTTAPDAGGDGTELPPRTDTSAGDHWPAFEQVAGTLVFERDAMRLRDVSGRLYGLRLSKVDGEIPNLARGELAIGGTVQGPLDDLLRFVRETPVDSWTGGALARARGDGQAQMDLALKLPLAHLADSQVRGGIKLADNTFQWSPRWPALAHLGAAVAFDNHGARVQDGRADWLGGEVRFEGGTQADGRLQAEAQGTVSAEALQAAALPPAAARVAGRLRGRTHVEARLGGSGAEPELTLTTAMTGMAVELPAPLGKPEGTARSLRLHWQGASSGVGAVSLGWGQVLQAEVRATGDGVRGGVAVGGARMPALPARGIEAAVSVSQFDVDAWQAVWDEATAEPGGGARAGASSSLAADDEEWLPNRVQLDAGQVLWLGRPYDALHATIRRGAGGARPWRVDLTSRQIAGAIEFRPGADDAGGVVARLQRLTLESPKGSGADQLQHDREASARVERFPSLDLVIDDLRLGERHLGRLQLRADNRVDAARGRREWALTRLRLGGDDAMLSGTGRWQPETGFMTLDFDLALQDSGAFLARMGYPDALRRGAGHFQGVLSWTGSPLVPDWPTLDGELHLTVGAGQFLKVDPGAAKLLGVLSLQALPRRLLLDFRDVFQEGFSFDGASGDAQVTRGVVHTENLRIRGVQAVVLMDGDIDLKAETQTLKVVVVPEINLGAAALAYAAVNPAIGLGSFLAQWVLRKPLVQANTREFRITGPWADPDVQTVARPAGTPLPETDGDVSAPAAAASAPGAAR